MQVCQVDCTLAVHDHVLDEVDSGEDTMEDVQRVNKVVFGSHDSLIDSVNKFTEVLFLASHLDINVDLLKDGEQVLLPEKPTHFCENIKPVLEINISQGSKEGFLDGAREIDE